MWGCDSKLLCQVCTVSFPLFMRREYADLQVTNADLPRPLTNQAARGQAPVRPPQPPPASPPLSLTSPLAAMLAACTCSQ
jgi:hypothetical protein